MKITKESFKDKIKIRIHFAHQIENKEEYGIVALCGIAGYFVQQNKLEFKANNNSLLIEGNEIVHMDVFDEEIDIIIYLDALKLFVKKVNEMMIWMGCQTFLNVYFNLYNNQGYKDILEFYQIMSKK